MATAHGSTTSRAATPIGDVPNTALPIAQHDYETAALALSSVKS
jgi:hypothetical protein